MKISLIVLVLFAFLGMLVFSTALHEFSHYADFHDIAYNESLCILNYDTSFNGKLGYYSFYVLGNEDITQREKYTEFKAYLLDFLVMSIFFSSLITVIWELMERKK